MRWWRPAFPGLSQEESEIAELRVADRVGIEIAVRFPKSGRAVHPNFADMELQNSVGIIDRNKPITAEVPDKSGQNWRRESESNRFWEICQNPLLRYYALPPEANSPILTNANRIRRYRVCVRRWTLPHRTHANY
jgi:hypothetical protein